MSWVWVFVGISVAGLVMLVAYGVWLVHKAQDLFSEFKMLGRRAGELEELVSGLRIPTTEAPPTREFSTPTGLDRS